MKRTIKIAAKRLAKKYEGMADLLEMYNEEDIYCKKDIYITILEEIVEVHEDNYIKNKAEYDELLALKDMMLKKR